MKTFFVYCVCFGMCQFSIACGEEETMIPTHAVYGTLISTSNDVDQCFAHLKLVVSDGLFSDPSQGRARCQFVGPQCQYRNNELLEGQYSVFAFIDRNHNANLLEPEPDSGDLLSSDLSLVLWQSTQLDFPDSVWHLIP